MAKRAHVSIGDVLNQLRDEFPDITISKIRFLESQGLVEPERTPSGYRKFLPGDVDRLRFILREQKEHFLPLKVIKERLDEIDGAGGLGGDTDHDAAPSPAPAKAKDGAKVSTSRRKAVAADDRTAGLPAAEDLALFETSRKKSQAKVARAVAASVRDDDGPDDLAPSETGVSLTRAELGRAAELSEEQVLQLEEFGLIAPAHTARDRVLFEEDALAIARVCAGFMRHGIEPRHLRMYRAFAEREAGLYEQVLLPYRRQRNPEAQARATETLGELSGLGRRLRTALLRQTVRRTFSS